jgi:hypothetical protein
MALLMYGFKKDFAIAAYKFFLARVVYGELESLDFLLQTEIFYIYTLVLLTHFKYTLI